MHHIEQTWLNQYSTRVVDMSTGFGHGKPRSLTFREGINAEGCDRFCGVSEKVAGSVVRLVCTFSIAPVDSMSSAIGIEKSTPSVQSVQSISGLNACVESASMLVQS